MNTLHKRLVPSIAFLTLAFASAEAHAVTENFCSFPTALTTWTYNGNAFEAENSEIRLTDSNVLNEASSAFATTPIALTGTTALHAYFQFQMGPSATGGEGVAFVLQNSSATGPAALGATGLKMAYNGISPSVEIVFGTVANTAGNAPSNSISVVLNGSTTANVKTAAAGFTMAGAGTLSAWVDYTPTGTSLSVYLAKTATATKPATPVLTYTGTTLSTLLGAQMYVGFTSSTGATSALTNEQDVYLLEVSTSGVPCGCEGDSACSGATPACDAVGICAVCSATNATACTGATPVCDVPTNACVGCLTDANCSGATPICDATNLTCRACATNADCSGSTPECATTGAHSGECVLCVADANCPPGSPKCTPSNTCAQCLTGANCGGDTPICKAGACVACGSDADCTGATPACEIWGACGQCSDSNGTACMGASDVCDFPTGTCVDCEFNSDCAGSTPTCDTATHKCAPCQTSTDCSGNPGGPACVTTGMKQGSCVVCAVDSDCTSAAAPKCDTTANECVACLTSSDCSAPTPECSPASICVGCLTSADCSGATPVCDTASSQCKPCENDFAATNPGPLSCPNAALGACQPAGSTLAGQCALCSSVNNSACVTEAATPVCISSVATCGCVGDTDCAPDTYCDTSTTSTGVCTAGCRTAGDAGVDNCSTGKYCTETDGTIGMCMGQPCNSNSDCKTPDPVCNTIVQPHACVACLNDPDCPKGDVCDSTNKCVECTPKQTTACSATAAGSACLASETCGCATDTSCGGPTSGRVCNTTTNACEPGCRGSGGNGCTGGETCSSTGGTIGACTAAVVHDAGTSKLDAGHAGDASDAGGDAAGPTSHVVSDAAGCGCHVTTSRDENPRVGAIFGLLLGLSLVARRRHGRGTELR